jgi:hypothetical protein
MIIATVNAVLLVPVLNARSNTAMIVRPDVQMRIAKNPRPMKRLIADPR